MKKMLAGLSLILVLTLCFCTVASSLTVSEAITEMTHMIDREIANMPDYGSAIEFDQKVEYDEETKTFMHLIYYSDFAFPVFAPTMDLGDVPDDAWEEFWTTNRRDAEAWLLNDYVVSLGIPGSAVVMKFVSCLDEESEDYLVYYSLTMDRNFNVTILENNLTDDFEPVMYK